VKQKKEIESKIEHKLLFFSRLHNKITNFNSSSVRGLLQEGRYIIAEKKHGNQEKKTKI